MKTEIRKKRNKLRNNALVLRRLAWEDNLSIDASNKLRQKQDDEYKKYQFYDNLIKAADKLK